MKIILVHSSSFYWWDWLHVQQLIVWLLDLNMPRGVYLTTSYMQIIFLFTSAEKVRLSSVLFVGMIMQKLLDPLPRNKDVLWDPTNIFTSSKGNNAWF